MYFFIIINVEIVTLQQEIDTDDDVTEMEHQISAGSESEKTSGFSEPEISASLGTHEEVQVQPQIETESKTEHQPEIEIEPETKPEVEPQPDIIITPRVEEQKVVKPKVEPEPEVKSQVEMRHKVAPSPAVSASKGRPAPGKFVMVS